MNQYLKILKVYHFLTESYKFIYKQNNFIAHNCNIFRFNAAN
jgi:hypothetical protein